MNRILIVETCNKRRLDLLRLFGRQGWEVETASTVSEGTSRLGDAPVDIVLISFRPPDPGALKDIARAFEGITL